MQEYISNLKLHILVLNLTLIILIFKITKSYYQQMVKNYAVISVFKLIRKTIIVRYDNFNVKFIKRIIS